MVTRDEELKWAYLLDPCFELTNSAGKPLTDGYIEVYIAGTRNKYYCASDFAGTLHPFQIPLDSLGSNIVLANPDNAYDVYVYNRFGNLIMSRYNVTPADGGAVISNTERINDLEELVVSAVTGLQGQIDDINEALDGKKDKQEEYSVTLTPTQTVSAIIQNDNGEIEVIYQEIDLPEEVPNVNIISPASTLNITSHIDEETNTKTFSIDLSDLGHLEYGQFMATQAVYTGANMRRIKGNLNTTQDGKIQLHKGNSYHITVRGYYTCGDLSNTSDTLSYIEYSTFTNMPVNIDNTVAGPQYFEISYDIFKLSADTNYYIAFASSAGTVSHLTVEIHSLSNISVLDQTETFEEGWGINIVSSVISVDPDIFNDYSTHTEVYEATVTAIQAATSVFPEALEAGQYINIEDNVISVTGLQPEGDYATREELDEAVTAVSSLIPDSEEVQFEEINLNDYALASAIPDVSDFTTHSEVYEAVVTGVQLATSVIPDPLEAGQYVSIENNVITVTGLQPEGDYATNADVYEATVTAVNVATAAIPDSEEVQFEEINLADYALASAIPDVSDFTTHTEVYESTVTAIETVTAMIPDAQVQSDWEQSDDAQPDYIKHKPNLDQYATDTEVSEAIVTAIEAVTAMIPEAQVQSDWIEQDTTDPAYIQNKPVEYDLVAGNNITITVTGTDVVISSNAGPVTGYATEAEVYNATVTAIETVTAMIPEGQVQSDWTEDDSADPSYIQNKPNELNLIAGDGIHIGLADDDIIISAVASGYVTQAEVYNAVVTGVQTATGVIPDSEEVQFEELDITQFAQASAIPDISNLATQTDVYNAVVTGVQTATAAIPDVSDMATQTWVNNQGFLTSVPSTYATDTEVSEAIATSVTGFVTESQVTALIPESEEVQFEELDITQFAQVSAIPTVQLNGDDQVTAINNHEIAGGGTTYTAGNYISINQSNAISVTGIEPPIIVEYGQTYSLSTVRSWNNSNKFVYVVINERNYYGNEIPNIDYGHVVLPLSRISYWTDAAVFAGIIKDGYNTNTYNVVVIYNSEDSSWTVSVTKLVTPSDVPTVQLNGDNQVTAINNHEIAGTGGTTYTAGEYISIENDEISVTGLDPLPEIVEMDALEIKAGNNIAIVTGVSDITISVTGIETPDTEDVTFEEINLANYALASAIPDVTSYATHTEVYNAVVTGVQTATGLIPDVSDMATKTWVGNQGYLTEVPNTYATDIEVSQAIVSAVSGKQDTLTGITDVQVVNSLPASPTQNVLYLIVEA